MEDLSFIVFILLFLWVICLIILTCGDIDYNCCGTNINKIEDMNIKELKKHLSKKTVTRTKIYYYVFESDAKNFVKNYTKNFIDYFGYKLIDVKYDYDLETFWDYDTEVRHIFNGTCITPIYHKHNFRNPRSYENRKVIITYETVPNYNKYFNIFGFAKCELPFQK